MSVQVAIAEAGGFTGAANKNEVQLQRAAAEGQLQAGKSVAVNVSELLQSNSKPTNTVLAGSDDVIFVPRRLF